MKKLEMKKIEVIEGGINFAGAACFAGALASFGDTAVGSPERYILLQLYNSVTGCNVQ